jgi:HrpA-like RNA helicase
MSVMLPVDQYREEILSRIQKDRVTIIHGETGKLQIISLRNNLIGGSVGCGKSSRIPVMLYEDSETRGTRCRMMVSQPRRIAASTLMSRVRLVLGSKVYIHPTFLCLNLGQLLGRIKNGSWNQR